MIPSLKTRPYVAPTALTIPKAAASVQPLAQHDARHIAGGVRGRLLTYADLNAFAWWYGGGWLTLNRGKKRLRRVHRGAEDVSRVRR